MSLVKTSMFLFQKQSCHSSLSEPAIVLTLTILSRNVLSDALTSRKRFTEMNDGKSTVINLYGDVISPCMSVKHARWHCLSVSWMFMELIRAVSNRFITDRVRTGQVMFSRASVCPQGDLTIHTPLDYPLAQTHHPPPWRNTPPPPQTDTPPQPSSPPDMPRYGQSAVGTHPPGTHSCS